MKDKFTKKWIIETGVPLVKEYKSEGIDLTLRSLHYRLVAAGMTNSINHYKRVVNAMIDARWDGLVEFSDFVDHDRNIEGKTNSDKTNVDSEIGYAKEEIQAWMTAYNKNRWENQPIYPEVFIEKKALQGVFDRPCYTNRVALCPCKGYPSLTYLYDASKRFNIARRNGQKPLIIYFGDYDPSGEDIPRSIQENLNRMGCEVDLKRIALLENQVIEWRLPPAPAKKSDTRTATWEGLGQVELDAVEPRKLQSLVNDAINDVFDNDLYNELLEIEQKERSKYVSELKTYVQSI